MGKKKNKRSGVMYSTDPEFEYTEEQEDASETLSPDRQRLKLYLDNKNRKGKAVTIVEGFVGAEEDLKTLEKEIKAFCGTGGSSKDGLLIIQGDLRAKIADWLSRKGYNLKVI